MIFYQKLRLLFFLIAATALVSCDFEKQIAREYVKKANNISLQVFTTPDIFKTNLRNISEKDYWNLPKYKKDSIFWKSTVVQHINDSILLTGYYNTLYKDLEENGFKVFTEQQTDSFLSLTNDSLRYNLNIVQLEMDEFYYPFPVYETDNQGGYYKNIDRTGVAFHQWIELTKINDAHVKMKTFFNSDTTTDYISGHYQLNNGTYSYIHQKRPVNVNDVYEMSKETSDKFSDYLYDYFMNQYIEKHLGHRLNRGYFYHYSFSDKKVYREYSQTVIILDKK